MATYPNSIEIWDFISEQLIKQIHLKLNRNQVQDVLSTSPGERLSRHCACEVLPFQPLHLAWLQHEKPAPIFVSWYSMFTSAPLFSTQTAWWFKLHTLVSQQRHKCEGFDIITHLHQESRHVKTSWSMSPKKIARLGFCGTKNSRGNFKTVSRPNHPSTSQVSLRFLRNEFAPLSTAESNAPIVPWEHSAPLPRSPACLVSDNSECMMCGICVVFWWYITCICVRYLCYMCGSSLKSSIHRCIQLWFCVSQFQRMYPTDIESHRTAWKTSRFLDQKP